MNKSHITNELVTRSLVAFAEHIGKPSEKIRAALEAAFPEPSIQELLSDEERSARHDDPQQPAAFGKLVVTEEMAEEYADLFYDTPACSDGSMKIILQNFVDKHSIKPIAFADRKPDVGQKIFALYRTDWISYGTWYKGHNPVCEYTHWLPASALPIPEQAVDAKESAWKEYDDGFHSLAEKLLFIAGYEAGQANNCPKD